jgi:beta-alanine--pyruvate transaminase
MKNEPAALGQAPSLRTGAYWMPFTHNRYLKGNPRSRVLARAEGAYYTAEGKRLFDCLSGLWCCPLGQAKIARRRGAAVEGLD